MRRTLLAAILTVGAALAAGACAGTRFARTYEYEEDLHLDLDGSATLVVNASIPALVALHGVDLPVDPRARLDRQAIRRAYESAVTDVQRVSRPWRRQGRRFVQIRLRVADVRRLGEAAPFAGNACALGARGERIEFRRALERGARRRVTGAGWTGRELVAYKLHLPSRVYYHNVRDVDTAEPRGVERGNILRWEQRLADRLAGVPLVMEVQVDPEPILYRTLWLFALAFAAALGVLAALVAWAVRRGRAAARSAGRGPGAAGLVS